jgi:cation:H+ antiporter
MDTAFLIIGGLVLLSLGGEFLVRGAVQLAERLGVSPLVIGLTLVGFGTSTPELVTSVQAALIDSPGIAVGNIVGSNIANILVILGFSALLSPIIVTSRALARDGVLVVATAVAFTAISLYWTLDRLTGTALLAALVAYIVYAWRQESTGADGHTAAYDKAAATEMAHEGMEIRSGNAAKAANSTVLVPLGFALAGLVLVILGGRFLVDGAIGLARQFGISETVIGLTIVAVGTSMPELVTSVIAAFRRQSEVALGNVLGSNIYNILGIGGVTALVSPTAVPVEVARFDAPVMVAVSILMLVFAATGLRVGRREGAALLAGYVVYVIAIWPK